MIEVVVQLFPGYLAVGLFGVNRRGAAEHDRAYDRMCVRINTANSILTGERRLRNVIGVMVKLVKIIFLKDGVIIRDSVIEDLGDAKAVFASAFDDIAMMVLNL